MFSKFVAFLFFILLSLSTQADILIGFNGSYSQFKDKRSDGYGFSPLGAGYGIELGTRMGPFRILGSFNQSNLTDNIIHDGNTGEFKLSSTTYTFLIDTLLSSRLFFGLGYNARSTSTTLTGNFSTSSKEGAFSRYNLEEKNSINGLLLRVGYKFLRTKNWSANLVFQRNMFDDNRSENMLLLNLRFFISYKSDSSKY